MPVESALMRKECDRCAGGVMTSTSCYAGQRSMRLRWLGKDRGTALDRPPASREAAPSLHQHKAQLNCSAAAAVLPRCRLPALPTLIWRSAASPTLICPGRL